MPWDLGGARFKSILQPSFLLAEPVCSGATTGLTLPVCGRSGGEQKGVLSRIILALVPTSLDPREAWEDRRKPNEPAVVWGGV